MPNIVYVDASDNVIGAGSREAAIANEITRRIVRIYIHDNKGNVLLQRRAEHLASMPSYWDQSVGGHVDEGETYDDAAQRELKEELGIEHIVLNRIEKYFEGTRGGTFTMLYVGEYNDVVHPNPGEVSAVEWFSIRELQKEMEARPSDFTPGCRSSFDRYLRHIQG